MKASADLLLAARLFECHLLTCSQCSREKEQVCEVGEKLLEQFRLVLVNDALLDLFEGTIQ